MYNIIICDDQDIVREGLQTIISTDKEIEVIATFCNGDELLTYLHAQDFPGSGADTDPPGQLDLILMDLKMPVKNGIQTTKEIRRFWPGLPVLVLTTYADEDWVIDAIKAGAAGYILKDTPRRGLIDAIKGTIKGAVFVDPSIAGTLLTHLVSDTRGYEKNHLAAEISERELELLKLIARGFSNTEIGERLHLSTGTIRNYTSMLFTKLEVTDRTQAVITALRAGLIHLEEL